MIPTVGLKCFFFAGVVVVVVVAAMVLLANRGWIWGTGK
jgi:hypothetical protein